MNTSEALTKVGEAEEVKSEESPVEKGNLIVLTGPSGVGKGTIVEKLFARMPELRRSISVTTRTQRPGEIDGEAYFFVDRPTFKGLIKDGLLMEWAEFAGNLYGTPRTWVEDELAKGFDVILEIEVIGARLVKECHSQAVLIFIAPPSFGELERRLRGRATETPEKIALRLAKAKDELQEKNVFHYEVVNDNLDLAINNLEHIVYAERLRIRQPQVELSP
jgi:guanylate kinase